MIQFTDDQLLDILRLSRDITAFGERWPLNLADYKLKFELLGKEVKRELHSLIVEQVANGKMAQLEALLD